MFTKSLPGAEGSPRETVQNSGPDSGRSVSVSSSVTSSQSADTDSHGKNASSGPWARMTRRTVAEVT